jgi:hypothetical protein
MNNLSIFIYLAELIPAIGHLAVGMAIASVVGLFFSVMIWDFNKKKWEYDSKEENAAREGRLSMGKFGIKFFPLMFVVCCVVGTIIPSRNTIMMIAASEYGETLYKSESVQEIINPATKLLKSYIKEELDKREKK